MISQDYFITMVDAEVYLDYHFFTPTESNKLLTDLTANIAWGQKSITIMGKQVMQPRLIAWYGDEGKSYRYSGLTVHPLLWTPTLLEMKARVEQAAGVTFNSVLLNLYRDGQDSVGWHSDDEPELGLDPVIASVSLGAARNFQFKHKQYPDMKVSIELTHGSLLLMRGTTQHFWKHQIPKTKKELGPRINLTFRVIH
ncbi:MAG: alpha-ketoglutarate-dependent dioxygenase AlkB [Anaerolineaceae bacterium]|nr:alpha-ketoglutarate-dependent dioxygenase AlkB [Anaerolineaceae bacterium]